MPAGHGEHEVDVDTTGRVEHGTVELPTDRRTRAPAFDAPPSIIAVPHDPLAAPRARSRVVAPTESRPDPHSFRVLGHGRHHDRVIGVGDDLGARRGVDAESVAPTRRGAAHLFHPIELVARQVQQHDDLGPRRLDHGGKPALVDLGDQPRARFNVGVHQHRDQAAWQVGAVVVAYDRPGEGGGVREEPRGGGLAVGAAHENGGAPRGEDVQRLGLDPQRDVPPDDVAAPSSGELREAAGGATNGEGDPKPWGEFPHATGIQQSASSSTLMSAFSSEIGTVSTVAARVIHSS